MRKEQNSDRIVNHTLDILLEPRHHTVLGYSIACEPAFLQIVHSDRFIFGVLFAKQLPFFQPDGQKTTRRNADGTR